MKTHKQPVPVTLTRKAVRPYRLLLGRGEEEKAAELADLTPHEQKQFVRDEVRDFDPKHDDPANQELLKVNNAYEICLDLGEDEFAEELRDFIDSTLQLQRAKEIVHDVCSDVDLVTGDYEVPEADEEDSDGEEAAASP